MTEKALKPIKLFLDCEEQIRNLIVRKGMIIVDRELETIFDPSTVPWYNFKNSRTIAYHLANRTVSIIPSLDKKE